MRSKSRLTENQINEKKDREARESFKRIYTMYKLLLERPKSPKMLAKDLGEQGYDISPRQVQRDLSAFDSVLGLYRVQSARGPKPALWKVDKESFLELSDRNSAMALAVVMAEKQLASTAPPEVTRQLASAFEEARHVIQNDDSSIGRWYQKVKVVNPSHWLKASKLNDEVFAVLRECALNNTVAELEYREHNSATEVQRVEGTCKGLLYRGNVVYVVIYQHERFGLNERMRRLPISRISAAKFRITTDPQGPENFDLTADANREYTEYSYGEPIRLQAIIYTSVQREIEDAHLGEEQRLTDISGKKDYKRLEVTVPYNLNLIQWLLARAAYIKVLGPEDFKRKFDEELRRSYFNATSDWPVVPEKNFVKMI